MVVEKSNVCIKQANASMAVAAWHRHFVARAAMQTDAPVGCQFWIVGERIREVQTQKPIAKGCNHATAVLKIKAPRLGIHYLRNCEGMLEAAFGCAVITFALLRLGIDGIANGEGGSQECVLSRTLLDIQPVLALTDDKESIRAVHLILIYMAFVRLVSH